MTYKRPAIWKHEPLPLDRIRLGDVVSYKKDDQGGAAAEDHPGILYQVDYEQITIGEETLFRPTALYVFPIVSRSNDNPHKPHDRLLPLHVTETGHLNNRNLHAAEIRLVRVPLDREHLGYHPARLHIAGSIAGTKSGEKLFERAQPYGLNELSSSLNTDLSTLRRLSGYQSALARVIQDSQFDRHHLGDTAFEPNTIKAFLGYLSAQNQKPTPVRPIPLFSNNTDDAPADNSQDWITSGHIPEKSPWIKLSSLMADQYGTSQISDLALMNQGEIENILSELRDEKPSYAEVFRLTRILNRYAPEYPALQDTARRMFITIESAEEFEKDYPDLSQQVRTGLENGADLESLIAYAQEKTTALPARKQPEVTMRAINFISRLYQAGIVPPASEIRNNSETASPRKQSLKRSFGTGLSRLSLDDAQKIFDMAPDVVTHLKNSGAVTLMDAYNRIKDGYRPDAIISMLSDDAAPRRGRPRHLSPEAQKIDDRIKQAAQLEPPEQARKVLSGIEAEIRRHTFNIVAKAVTKAREEFSEDRQRYEDTNDSEVRAQIAQKYGFEPK